MTRILCCLFVLCVVTIFGKNSENIVKFENDRKVVIADKFLKNYRSNMPVVFLIENTKAAHENAAQFYSDFLFLQPNPTEFLLIKFNATGPSPVLTTNLKNEKLFKDFLKWNEANSITTSLIASNIPNRSALFYSILKATYALPLSAGIIIFADNAPTDEDLALLALQEVMRKRIKMFVIWSGLPLNLSKEAGVLKEAAVYSNGAFFVVSDKNISQKYAEAYQETTEATKGHVPILYKTNLFGSHKFKFPIDAQTADLHISLSSTVQSAALISPSENELDLLNASEIESFTRGAFFMNASHTKTFEIHLLLQDLPATSVVGNWYLKVNGSGKYSVVVSVGSDLQVETETERNSTEKSKWKLNVKLIGDAVKVNKVRLLDKEGNVYKEDLKIYDNGTQYEQVNDNVEVFSDKTINIDPNAIPDGSFYVEINGVTNEGNQFRRLSYIDSSNYHFTLPSLTVDIGDGSELLIRSNQFSRIFFEVANNRDQTVFVRFRCHDERSLLVGMQPLSTWINPRQTVIVTVTVRAYSTINAYTDLITFSIIGFETAQKTAILNIGDDKITDYYEPYLYHRFSSDCMNYLLGNCQDGTWTIEATAQDTDSGLLLLSSDPRGLYVPSGYAAGTTEKVTGYYSGSCCHPRIQLSAIDRARNRKTYTADAYFSALSPGAIAAIVLGIVLLIFIIAGIVVCACRCCRQKDSVDLPVYRGPVASRSARI